MLRININYNCIFVRVVQAMLDCLQALPVEALFFASQPNVTSERSNYFFPNSDFFASDPVLPYNSYESLLGGHFNRVPFMTGASPAGCLSIYLLIITHIYMHVCICIYVCIYLYNNLFFLFFLFIYLSFYLFIYPPKYQGSVKNDGAVFFAMSRVYGSWDAFLAYAPRNLLLSASSNRWN